MWLTLDSLNAFSMTSNDNWVASLRPQAPALLWLHIWLPMEWRLPSMQVARALLLLVQHSEMYIPAQLFSSCHVQASGPHLWCPARSLSPYAR